MINSLKTIAFFGCSLTSRYRRGLCKCFNSIAKRLNVNIVYFNSLGKIGEKTTEYGDYEADIIKYIDLNHFDGIIFDGEGYNVEGMAEKVIEKLREAKCPVVSISNHVNGFYNIDFEDASGIRKLIKHFIEVHHHTKIGFMSGYLTHPDAQLRLNEFKTVMKEYGMPEYGAGMFEGDFWFYKGDEAADYFLSLPETPESIVCANDYMAISLVTAFKKRGIRVPEDIAVSGYDGSIEGKQYVPHITSATREREDIAEKALTLLLKLMNNEPYDTELIVYPRTIFTQSCGCEKLDYQIEVQNINEVYNDVRVFGYCLTDAESALMKLNKLESIEQIEPTFRECDSTFGEYSAFFLFMQTDKKGHMSCTSEFDAPTGIFEPIVWIDHRNEYIREEDHVENSVFIPRVRTDEPHFFYIMSTHCAEMMFGYALVEMEEDDIFTEFYNLCLLNISITLERLWKNDKISKLYKKQKSLSIHDGLTGMLNRRGFDEYSKQAISELKSKTTICTMVIDMDGLKHINDVYGHSEGDSAIKQTAKIITECCKSGEIAGRAGGDEFYLYVSDYSQEKLDTFNNELIRLCKEYNEVSGKPYKIELSYGSYLVSSDKNGQIENFLRISDSKMYKQKMAKPNRKKRE